MYVTVTTVCPDCEQVTTSELNIPPMFNFISLLELTYDNLAICPNCCSPRAGISSCTFHDTRTGDSFDLPIYKGPIGGDD